MRRDARTTRMIAIRHGETAWNLALRLQGHRDVGLNDTGRLQATRLAQALAGEPLDAIYASDLARSRHTARPLARDEGLELVGWGDDGHLADRALDEISDKT